MKELEKRLENIHQEIESFLSLQGELKNTINKLNTDNQELIKKIETLELKLKKLEQEGKDSDYQKQTNNTHKNHLINKKIDELLSEVQQCMSLLKR